MLSPSSPYSRGLCNGVFEALNGQRIFGADVDEALVGANGVAGNGHGFENGVGVAFAGGAVHVSARVTFVSVTNDIFLVGLSVLGESPISGRSGNRRRRGRAGRQP